MEPNPSLNSPHKKPLWNRVDLWIMKRPYVEFVLTKYVGYGVVAAGLFILLQFFWRAATTWAESTDDISKSLLAIGIIVAAPFAVWRIVISLRQAQAALQQAAAAATQANTSREGNFT